MAVPAIKALQLQFPDAIIDILVGTTPDDIGAYQILSRVVGHQGKIYASSAFERHYDIAIMAIPFDGRWKNGMHFNADIVIDGRTRPDPSTTGLVSWKRHEVEYQMDNVRGLGFDKVIPNCSFLPKEAPDLNSVYVGLGYKKDAAGFWKVKHWGNENYSEFIKMFLNEFPNKKIITTGDMMDMKLSIGPISRLVLNKRFEFKVSSTLDEALKTVASCGTYVGNDTGMMHVAASCNRKTVGLFFMENSIVKSHPWCEARYDIDGSKNREEITPKFVFDHIAYTIS